MKIARRLLSVLLALLMIFALAACGGGGTEVTDSGKDNSQVQGTDGTNNDPVSSGNKVVIPTTDEFEPPERPVEEMDGKTYIIIQNSEIENPFDYLQDSNMGLQAAERVSEVSEIYGCTIEFSMIPHDDQFVSAMQAAMFSENSGDLIFASNNAKLRLTLGTGGDSSLMQDLLAIDHIINFWDTNKWGSIVARECMMAGGTFYGVIPNLWVDCTPLPYYQIAYNKDIVVAANATDPQEYWENEAWDRYAMLDVIKATTDETSGIWGLSCNQPSVIRASFLASGCNTVNIDKVNADGTVEWTNGFFSDDALDALQWAKATLAQNAKCFKECDGWTFHEPFNEELSAMALTRPLDIFGSVVVDGPENFGLITWAGPEANSLTGFYEAIHAVSIPLFAQDIEHSAYLMYDLFKGLGDIEDFDDVLNYYADNYFNSDIDVECLVRQGARLDYSYWPNGLDKLISEVVIGVVRNSSVSVVIETYASSYDYLIEEHVLPNKVALKEWKDAGYFD